jgi:hypothetical protein
VLNHQPKNRTADQTDAATVAAFRVSLNQGFVQAWALSRTDPDAGGWIFPTAYDRAVKALVASARTSLYLGCPYDTG